MRRQLVILVAVVLTTGTAWRSVDGGFNVVPGDFVELRNGPGAPGGIFHVDVIGRGIALDFDTFCVELTEHINLDTRYYVENVGLQTVNGGRTLTAQAAWLYTQFLDQDSTALAGFNFSLVAGNPSSPAQAKKQADALQLGIWRGMVDGSNNPVSDSEIISLAGWNQTYINQLTTTYLTTWLSAFQNDGWSGTGNIKVMNLRHYKYDKWGKLVPTTYAQDQLVSVTPELPTVYSAGAMMGCAVLWGLVEVVRKRRAAVSAI